MVDVLLYIEHWTTRLLTLKVNKEIVRNSFSLRV